MIFVLLLIGGALLANALPHLAAGTRGESFPTPFATPRGVGLSSPLVNVLWGSANLAAGGLCARRLGYAAIPHGWIALGVGFVVMSVVLARHFGRVRAAQSTQSSPISR